MLNIFVNYKLGSISANSRRLDIMPLVLSITLLIISFKERLNVSQIVNYISAYSFGIYLIHFQVQRYVAPHTATLVDTTFLRVTLLFTISLILSMLITHILKLLPFGKYIIGEVKVAKIKTMNTE